MHTRRLRREALVVNASLALNTIPRDVWLNIFELCENPRDVCNMIMVSSYFSNKNNSYPIVLTAMKMRMGKLGLQQKLSFIKLKPYVHMEKGWKGIQLNAVSQKNKIPEHNSVVLSRQASSSVKIGRSDSFNQNIKDQHISRIHSIVSIPGALHYYTFNCLGQMQIKGQNGVRFKENIDSKVMTYVRPGMIIPLHIGNVIELGVDTDVLYEVNYIS